MNWSSLAIHPVGLALVGCIGLMLIGLTFRAALASKAIRSRGASLHHDLEHLLSEISRGLRILTPSGRSSAFLQREKQEEVGRKLAELQSRLRLLDDLERRKYEGKAGRVLAEAAQVGITLPPP